MGTKPIWMGMAVVLLSACQSPTALTPKAAPKEIAHEERLQKEMVDEAAKMGGIPRTWKNRKGATKQFERVAERIEKAGAEVCQEMRLPERKRRCYYYFERSRSRVINAYADGDSIIVNLGMMRFVENDHELAIVMGHEFAHNVMGHLEARDHNAAIGKMFGAMIDGASGYTGSYKKSAEAEAAAIGALSHSQGFEAEADYVGLYVAARAGYDVRQAVNFWRRMTLESPQNNNFAITHPSNPDRVASIQRGIAEIQDKRKRKEPLIPNMLGKPIEGNYSTDLDLF